MEGKFIVYRSEKYSGVGERALRGLFTYGRFSPLTYGRFGPFIANLLRQVLPIVGFILCSPLFVISFVGLLLIRKFQALLVRRVYPDAILCKDGTSSSNPSEGTVISIVWVKSPLNVGSIRAHIDQGISSGRLKVLGKVLNTKLSLKVWEDCPKDAPLNLEEHVSQAPAKFYDCLLTDELGDLHSSMSRDRPILQKFVSLMASTFPEDRPPWRITLVSLPPTFIANHSNKQNRTCVILQFHPVLLQHREVVQMLVAQLDDSLSLTFHGAKGKGHDRGSGFGGNICDGFNPVDLIRDVNVKEEVDRVQKLKTEADLWKDSKLLWMTEKWNHLLSDFETWFRLRRKQLEYHSRLAFILCLLKDWVESVFRGIQVKILLRDLNLLFRKGLKVIRALSYVPIILCTAPKQSQGFLRSKKLSTRLVSWSKPVPVNLLKDIQQKTEGSSKESIILMACSLALRDYYSENGVPRPSKIGTIVSSSSSEGFNPSGSKFLDLPTKTSDISSQIKNLSKDLDSFDDWRQLSLSFIERYASQILPEPILKLVFKELYQKRYPISFSFIDSESPFPHMSLWGQAIDEFTLWKSPPTDSTILITGINYAAQIRLSVLSPMKSIDVLLTQRFHRYLNLLAESVGVEKSRIPYSRNNSPISSASSSPDQKRWANFNRSHSYLQLVGCTNSFDDEHEFKNSCNQILLKNACKDI